MTTPESLLAEALHEAEVGCWPNVDGCTGALNHGGDALDLLAHAPLHKALVRGLALTALVRGLGISEERTMEVGRG